MYENSQRASPNRSAHSIGTSWKHGSFILLHHKIDHGSIQNLGCVSEAHRHARSQTGELNKKSAQMLSAHAKFT